MSDAKTLVAEAWDMVEIDHVHPADATPSPPSDMFASDRLLLTILKSY